MGNQFKKGDVVQLKSGGPKMTVTEITDESNYKIVHCRFFDKKNTLQTADFDESELAHYKQPVGFVGVCRR